MKYKFDDNTSIMIDRSYVDFSGVEYQIKYFKDKYYDPEMWTPEEIKEDKKKQYSDHYKNGVSVRITKKGFKTLEENLNKLGDGFSYEYILEFVSDDLKRYLYFSDLRDIEPEVYKQILEKEEIEICDNCDSVVYHLDICAVCRKCDKCCSGKMSDH